MPSLFVLGATGHIGSAVLFTWLKEVPDLKVTALVRDDRHAAVFSKYGITTVKGSNDSLDLIKEYSAKSDIVLNAADADAEGAVKAILEGTHLHFKDTGAKAIFIHTSGVMVLEDGAQGYFNPSAKWYDDRDVEALKNLPPSALHRSIEQMVIDADEAGYVSAYIVSPGTIYGKSDSPIPRVSLLANLITTYTIAAKGAPILGDGSNIMNVIHIKDIASFYTSVLKYALSGNDKSTGWNKYYLAAGTEVPWGAVLKAFGKILHQKGALKTAEPVSVEGGNFPYLKFFGVNIRAFPGRATQLGWRLTQPSIFDSLEQDIDIALKAQ